MRDFQEGVYAWLGPHIQAPPGSPSTPHLPAGNFCPLDGDDGDAPGIVQGTYGRRATPPRSPFSMPQQQYPEQLASEMADKTAHEGIFRGDSARQPGLQHLTGKGRVDEVLGELLPRFDSEETDLEDYD